MFARIGKALHQSGFGNELVVGPHADTCEAVEESFGVIVDVAFRQPQLRRAWFRDVKDGTDVDGICEGNELPILKQLFEFSAPLFVAGGVVRMSKTPPNRDARTGAGDWLDAESFRKVHLEVVVFAAWG